MAGECEIAFFEFMEKRRLISNDDKRRWGVTHAYFGTSFYKKLTKDFTVKDRGAFHVDDSDYDEYIRLCCEALAEDAYLKVMERPSEYSPLCVDVDLRYTKEVEESHSMSHAHDIHRIVLEMVRPLYKLEEYDDDIGTLFEKLRAEAKNERRISSGISEADHG